MLRIVLVSELGPGSPTGKREERPAERQTDLYNVGQWLLIWKALLPWLMSVFVSMTR